MPTVAVKRDHLFHALGKTYTDAEFEDLCFEFGIELDDVTSEREIQSKQGQVAAALSEDVVYKIEVPANRYDLLCLEGLVLALRIFLGLSTPPVYTAVTPPTPLTLTQHPATLAVRPFIVAAVLRGVTFDEARYRSFIDLQDKLHQNIGRRRTLVAIGTHDLDTLSPPFTYEALPQPNIAFKPLGEDKEYTVDALFQHYREKNSHLLPYLPITESFPVHPVIYDSQRRVLSLPPIINGEHSKITMQTRNVFIECTGTDATKLSIVLQTIIAMFGQYCERPYEVEVVRIVDAAGKATTTPQLQTSHFTASVDYINRGIGVHLLPKDMCILLNRMSLQATLNPAEKAGHQTLTVVAPITRTDVLHACDIMEDVAIAYGYNKITKTKPPTPTIGKQLLVNKLSDQIREVIAQAGWCEVLTWALVSAQDNFVNMRVPATSARAVVVSNPKTAEFEQVRTSLLPGLLRALSSNKGLVNLPIRLFEVGDIVLADDRTEVGAHNERKLAALYCGLTSGFEFTHGLVDRVMQQNGFLFRDDQPPPPASAPSYHLVPSEHPQYFPGRQADVVVGEEVIGSFGVVHPEVLTAFEITFPCSAVEMDVERFIETGKEGQKEKGKEVKEEEKRAIHDHPREGNAYVH